MASKKFIDDFNLCMDHFVVIGEELEFEKQRCRDNMEEATICYASMAEKLRSKEIGK